ncbi:MAG: sirohydrochlorin chelatase [Oscillatoria sp. PMC 1051.18]|nr:sirohydrochlorin chelatase [Oscillatoria sp. PMC 1050.18]MEC5030132.1 sirohydrochlorin chelatase [Oscillatoria sp. PMC 1051.18]
MPSACLLVSHGSRDARPRIAVEQLANLVRQRLENQRPLGISPNWLSSNVGKCDRQKHKRIRGIASEPICPLVGCAALELTPMPLHESIKQFARRAKAEGNTKVQILPLFLLPGVHVKEDIPSAVKLAQEAIGEQIPIQLQPHLGSNPGLKQLLAKEFQCFSTPTRILLSHGSRRVGANEAIEAIASELKAIAAYWSVSPSLSAQVEALVAAEKQEIAIVPYFLFQGGITEAIATQVKELQLKFPHVQLLLGKPLGASAELADLVVEGVDK